MFLFNLSTTAAVSFADLCVVDKPAKSIADTTHSRATLRAVLKHARHTDDAYKDYLSIIKVSCVLEAPLLPLTSLDRRSTTIYRIYMVSYPVSMQDPSRSVYSQVCTRTVVYQFTFQAVPSVQLAHHSLVASAQHRTPCPPPFFTCRPRILSPRLWIGPLQFCSPLRSNTRKLRA